MSRPRDVNPAPHSDTAPAPRARGQRIPLGHCNKVTILRTLTPVTGSWIVNRSLSVPTALMEELNVPDRFTETNLWLESVSKGVNADVRVANAAPPPGVDARTHLMFCGGGSVTVRLHSLGNLPTSITALSYSKDVHVSVPVDFVGVVVTICGASFAPTLPSLRCRPLSELPGNGRYFIGDWPAAAGSWRGNKLRVIAPNGRVRVEFVSLESALIYEIKSSEGYAVVSSIPKGPLVAMFIGLSMMIAPWPTIGLCVLWLSWHFYQTRFPL